MERENKHGSGCSVSLCNNYFFPHFEFLWQVTAPLLFSAGLSLVASGGTLTGRQLDAVSQSIAAALRVSALLGLCEGNEQLQSAASSHAGVPPELQVLIFASEGSLKGPSLSPLSCCLV
jgi:hypothetical protein